jgi:hypothetical protein
MDKTDNSAALLELAKAIRRPPISLNDFSTLSDDQLTWLSDQVHSMCQREYQQEQQQLRQKTPWLLRVLALKATKHNE